MHSIWGNLNIWICTHAHHHPLSHEHSAWHKVFCTFCGTHFPDGPGPYNFLFFSKSKSKTCPGWLWYAEQVLLNILAQQLLHYLVSLKWYWSWWHRMRRAFPPNGNLVLAGCWNRCFSCHASIVHCSIRRFRRVLLTTIVSGASAYMWKR